MKNRGYLFLLGFTVLLVLIGIACNIGVTPTPTAQPTTQSQPQLPTPTPSNSNSSAPITFVDQNKFYQIDVPGDWIRTSNSGTNAYIDQFTAPDGNAVVENISYNDGKPFKGADNSRMALMLLRQFYSNGKEGDIRVSEDKIMQDGAERLTWTSKGRNYSGMSYLRVRDGVNFLMFTVEWSNDHQSAYADVLNKIQASYKTP